MPRIIESITAANTNDLTQRQGQYRNRSQLKIVSNVIVANPIRTVLDFGCGGGGLVHKLAARFPDITFTGVDVNSDFPTDLANLTFKTELQQDRYDLVILSHVIEHIPDARAIRALFELVRDNGLVYVEVPNPLGYGALKQPHFCYYLDRLHVNHFSQRSILKIAPKSFEFSAYGAYELPYPLGKTYPAQYAVFRRTRGFQSAGASLSAYVKAEFERWQDTHSALKAERFYVYGFGDNFHRSTMKGGPLHGLDANIMAIIDRNASRFRARGKADYVFLEPSDVAEINGHLIVCTVSQFTDMRAFFKRNYPQSKVIYL